MYNSTTVFSKNMAIISTIIYGRVSFELRIMIVGEEYKRCHRSCRFFKYFASVESIGFCQNIRSVTCRTKKMGMCSQPIKRSVCL